MSSSVIKVGQLGINYIVDGAGTSSMGMFELTVPPGSNVPPRIVIRTTKNAFTFLKALCDIRWVPKRAILR